MNNNKILNNIENESFIANNGTILRTFRILSEKYKKLSSVQSNLSKEGISEAEFIESINFLEHEKYLAFRTIVEHETVMLADYDYCELEAQLTGKGIRLLRGGIKDNMIGV